jgi:hypothetical protein
MLTKKYPPLPREDLGGVVICLSLIILGLAIGSQILLFPTATLYSIAILMFLLGISILSYEQKNRQNIGSVITCFSLVFLGLAISSHIPLPFTKTLYGLTTAVFLTGYEMINGELQRYFRIAYRTFKTPLRSH